MKQFPSTVVLLGGLLVSGWASAGPPEADAPAADWGDPVEQHEILEGLVGDWTYVIKWSLPQPDTTGEAKGEWVLGKRFVRHTNSETALGLTSEHIGYFGYDRMVEAYTYTWMDSLDTTVRMATGQYDAASKTLTLEGTFRRTGMEMPHKVVVSFESADTYKVEMWEPGAYDILGKMRETTYTRKK